MTLSKDNFSTNQSSISAEACAWIAQLETGELTQADQDAFREWVGRSQRHANEIRRQAKMSQEMNVLSGMAQSISTAAREHAKAVSRKRSRPRYALGATAAALVICACLLLFSQFRSPVETLIYTTAVGESQTVTLPDGSAVQLNTDSFMEVTYSKNDRKIRLIRGEAFFDVTHNPERPFWVYADDHYIRVVGTAFLVSLVEDEFEIMVTEGRVELAATPLSANSNEEVQTHYRLSQNPLPTPREPIALNAGQSISISEARSPAPIQTLSNAEQRRELSWQEGLHEFSSTPLEEVVNELSRYNGIKYEFKDPELRGIEFGGVFRIGETEQLFDALETAYGIQVRYMDDQSIQLSRAASN